LASSNCSESIRLSLLDPAYHFINVEQDAGYATP
jgi:hypothetical protein